MDLNGLLASNAGGVGQGSSLPSLTNNGITPQSPSNSASALGSQDFFQLLIAQLTNQDPLAPTGNDELLRQISSIREIELSTTLTQSLQALSGQQQFGTASSLIGQYVSGSDGNGQHSGGIVTAIRFADGGRPMLQLSTGVELPMEQIRAIQSPFTAAQSLVGQRVFGVSRTDGNGTEMVEGVVSSVTANNRGEAQLELDTGEILALADVLGVAATV